MRHRRLASLVLSAAAAVSALEAATPPLAPADADHVSSPAALEGRAPDGAVSPLQTRVDAAAPGATVTVGPGTYEGDLVIERPLRLVGVGRPRLLGSRGGSVIRIRADDVRVEGFDIDGREGGALMRDSSGVHVAGRRAVIADLRIQGCLFGVYLRAADGAVVERCRIRGIPGKTPGEKGSGIHVWNTDGFRLTENELVDVRDGLYVQSSPHGVITGNVARDLRYGLHYMYSDDNLFEGNTFERGAAGAAIMYSKNVVFRRNRLVRNRGFASAGLLIKSCDAVVAEDNLIADNARGVFLEGSNDSVLRRNVVAGSDRAIVLYDSCARVRVAGNSFVANLTPLDFVGRRTDTLFEGNYWSGNGEPDLDGDGVSDRPYRLSDIFDHLRGNLLAADLMAQGSAALALAAAEESFPVLRPVAVLDPRPLVRPPALDAVPAPDRAEERSAGLAPAAVAALGCLSGIVVLARLGRRP